MPIYALGDLVPTIDETAFIHPDAVLIGDVVVGPEASVWPTAVLRADNNRISVGAQTSMQDGTIVHYTDKLPTISGARCDVGYNVHHEGCTIEDDALIGSGSVVLHRVIVRSWSLVAAQALVSGGTEVPAAAMAVGVPARIKEGKVTPDMITPGVEMYLQKARNYPGTMRRISG